MTAISHPQAYLRWLLIGLVATVPMLVRLAFYPMYPGADDAFIHMAIVDSLRESGTWGINPGETVHLSTSPVFTLLFYALSFLSRDLLMLGAIVSVLSVAGATVLTYKIAERSLGDFSTSLAVALLAATNIHLWRWTGTFMEATFANFLVVLNVRVQLSQPSGPMRNVAQGVLIGLTALVRPELALLAFVFFLHGIVFDRSATLKRTGWVVVGLAAVAGPYIVWSRSYFGTILPTTFYAKTTGTVELVNLNVAKQIVQVVLSGFPALVLLIVASVAITRRSQADPATKRDLWLFIAVPFAGFMFFYLKTPSLQSAGRYLLPFMATLPLVAIHLLSRARIGATIALGIAAVQLGAALYLNVSRISPVLTKMWGGYVSTMREGAREIESRVPDDQTVLVYYDIGVVSWQLKGARRIEDGGALASPQLRGLSLDEMVEKTGVRYVLESLGNPDYPIQFEGRHSRILWERSFPSHGVENPNRTYTARLYELAE